MDKEKELPKRKSTRLKNFDYSSAGAYFVTICTRDRKQILSEIVKTDFTATNKAINSAVGEGVVCAFKSLTSRICKQRYGIEKMFQRSYAEHIIRNRQDYETRIKYIYENPMRWYYKQSNTAQM